MNKFLQIDSSDSGQPLRCLGTTQRGQACKNAPVKGKRFCPTHLKRRRIKLTAIISIAIVVLGVLADWIEVSSYFGIDIIKKSSSTPLSNDAPNYQQGVLLDSAPLVIKQISRIKSTIELLKFLNTFVRKGDIAVGDYSDFEDDGTSALYVLIVDDTSVLGVFRYKNFVFYDINSNYSCKELRTKYKNKKRIWLLHFSE